MVDNVNTTSTLREDGTLGYYELGPYGTWGTISFQNGPVKEVRGRNGTFIEEILEGVLMHRLRELNNKFPCEENTKALQSMNEALYWLSERTRKRQDQQVEGLNLAHTS